MVAAPQCRMVAIPVGRIDTAGGPALMLLQRRFLQRSTDRPGRVATMAVIVVLGRAGATSMPTLEWPLRQEI